MFFSNLRKNTEPSVGANRAMRVIIGDIVCQNHVSTKIDGYLKDALPDKSFTHVQTKTEKYQTGLEIKFDFEVTEWNKSYPDPERVFCPLLLQAKYTRDTLDEYHRTYFPRVYYCSKRSTFSFQYINLYNIAEGFEVSIADLQEDHEVIYPTTYYLDYYGQFANITVNEKTTTIILPGSWEHDQYDQREIYFASLEEYGIILSNLTITEI